MTMLTEVVDAVIGTGTHRDTHEAVIADAAGKPIAVMRIGNDSAGFARLLAAIAEMAPGPRVAVCIEGSRSYGIGLARALAAAGLLVLECEQPSRKQRRGKGKSDSIDAHLAVLAALRLDAGRLPVPRADGDREALRILLVARQEMTEACTAQAGRLRALLLAGDDAGRRSARTTLSGRALAALADREPPADASREQAVRQAGGRVSRVLSRLRPPPQGRSRSVRSSDTGARAGVRLVSSRGLALRHTREGDEKDVWDRAGVEDVIHFARSLDERLPRAVRGDLALGADR
jgi:hypothetical protein